MSGVASLMEASLQTPGTASVHIDVGQICGVLDGGLHDHPHQTLENETSQYTPHLVKTVVQEVMKVESSKPFSP